MKHKIQLEAGAELEYEYVPVQGSGNALLGQKYRTNVWIVQGNSKYDLGYWDEKLDDIQVKARFEEIIRINQERQYGTAGTVLRRELTSRRQTSSERLAGQNLRSRYKISG